jgi:peptidoglycan/LPS O-acetylase OafA/YrhL
MRRVLADWLAGRDNNFNLIRAIAASLVIYSHSFAFKLGYDARGLARHEGDFLFDFSHVESGKFAVQVFFAISGFLVAQSWENSASWRRFAAARVLRIFPGLIVCLLALAFVLGPAFTALPIADYLRDSRVYRFLAIDTTLLRMRLEYCLPGVFQGAPGGCALNVPHWTLPWEVLMYISLGLLGVLGLIARRGFVLLAGIAMLVAFRVSADVLQIADWRLLYPLSFGSFFYAGTLLWLYRDRVPMTGWTLAGALLVLIGAMGIMRAQPIGHWLYIPLLAYCVLGLALLPSGPIRAYNRFGDYSYGIYIYGYAAQQVVNTLFPGLSANQLTLAAIAAVLVAAVPSWHWLEKPALRLKGRVEKREPLAVNPAPM